MVNARQQGAPLSMGIAEEVYVSVTAYSKEVRTVVLRFFLLLMLIERPATASSFSPAVDSSGRDRRTEDVWHSALVGGACVFDVAHAPDTRCL